MEKLNVVIADDDDVMRQLLGAIVQSDEELTVVGVAKDGEEAVQLIKEKEPDVMLLDVVMPKLDGLGVLESVSKDDSIRKVPSFIMVSAVGRQEITEDRLLWAQTILFENLLIVELSFKELKEPGHQRV